MRAEPTPAQPTVAASKVDEATALEKIQTFWSETQITPESVARLETACRDFCRRFPEAKEYVEVRRFAVIYWTMGIFPGSKQAPIKIEGWDPADAERDPKLDAEQQADIAMLLANGRANQRRDWKTTFAEKQFDAVVAALPPHRGTKKARDALIDAALRLPPERAADALAELRKDFPDDLRAKECGALLTQLGQPCELHATALDGRVIDLRDYRGKVVLLEFWAKGCGGCIASIPGLKKLAERFGPRGFAIIGVNMDTRRSDAEEIVKQHALTWPQIFDGGGWHAALADRFFVGSIPRGVLIDREGRLAALDCSADDTTQKRLEALLAGKRGPERIKSADEWKNTGAATPSLAFETMLWAYHHKQPDVFAGVLGFSGEAQRQKIAVVFGHLSEKERAAFGTPEKMLARMWLDDEPNSVEGFQIVGETAQSPDEATVSVCMGNTDGTGDSDAEKIPFRRDAGGWKFRVSDEMIDRLLAQGARRSSRSAK